MLGEWQIARALLDLKMVNWIALETGNGFVKVGHGLDFSACRIQIYYLAFSPSTQLTQPEFALNRDGTK